MFKRANKVTALLVAAASVMSVVPAMAADSTSRLGTKDGTIQHAIAFKDGKYLYEGYKSDDSDQGIYYNGGDKDKSLDDVQDADIIAHVTTTGSAVEAITTDGSYQDKYAFVKDGSDEYLVDLTNGSVVDDNTPSDYLDTAVTKLKSALKKTDRYNDSVAVADTDLTAIPGAKFDSNTWYEYTVAPTSRQDNSASTGKLYGFTTQNGKYIDASNLANIYAYSTAKAKFVKIDEFDKYDTDNKLSASLLAEPEVLAQDKDYIYAKVSVAIFDGDASAISEGQTTSAAVSGDADTVSVKQTVHTYIQKIAKAQGDKKDDAYLPKSVASYEVDSAHVLDCGDAQDAVSALDAATNYSVVNGQLLAIDNSGTNVKVTAINLKKDKVKFESGYKPTDFNLSDKVDVYLAEKDDSDDVDVDGANAWDVDVDGNVWVVAKGDIYKYENNKMTKVYTCDSSLDSISVYDKSNMIAWSQDKDIYTTVNEGTAQTSADAGTTTTAPVVTPAQTGWVKLADGTWNFFDATGVKAAGKWINDGGVWYFLKADGAMATGWYNDNGTWYFLKSSGAMATGWVQDGGAWYYLNASGAMLANTTTPDGYYVNASGAWV